MLKWMMTMNKVYRIWQINCPDEVCPPALKRLPFALGTEGDIVFLEQTLWL